MMKPINIMLILLCIVLLLFKICNSNVEFTRIIRGRVGDSSWYRERILIKNIPRNKMKQSKIMISYFDSIGLSMNNLLEMPEIKAYKMDFYKSTYATRAHFLEDRWGSTSNGNKTYLGSLHMGHCQNDSTKWRVRIVRNLGTSEDFDILGPVIEDEYLQYDCDSNWYEANKNNELVRYYMELRRRRGALR